jgi:hypothetical protein
MGIKSRQIGTMKEQTEGMKEQNEGNLRNVKG